MKLKSYQNYLITALILLIWFGVRIFRIDALPFFIDEMLIVQRSQQTLAGSPLGFATQGKLLLPWIGALFNPMNGGWWILRVVTLLLILPSAAAIIAIGKKLHKWQTGWYALVLIIITLMLHFHDRLALSDTVLTGMLTLFTLFLLWTFDVPKLKIKIAILSGVIFIIAMLAKSSAILLLPLPLVAAIILPKIWTIRQRIIGLGWVYGTILILWLPFQAILLWRGIDFFGRAAQSSTSGALLDIDRILSNIAFVWAGYLGYSHWIFWLMLAIGICFALYFHLRSSLFLLAMCIGYGLGLILFGETLLYYRYWLPPLPIFLLVGIIGLFSFASFLNDNKRKGIARYAPTKNLFLLCLFLAVFIFEIQFIYTSYSDPINLNLPHLDKQQYIESDSAGTALPETAQFLVDIDVPIYGAFANCPTLDLYSEHDVICLDIAGNENVRLRRVNNTLAQVDTPFILVLESQGYAISADISVVELNPLVTFERPNGLISIIVYEASSND